MAGISSLTSRDAVLKAINDFDRRGRVNFLEHHRFGPARWWYVVHGGKQYDSKALVGVAIGIQTGKPSTSHDFKGGEANAVRRLQSLGFTVVRVAIGDDSSPIPEEVTESFPEGLRSPIVVNRAERSAAARLACIAAHGTSCSACGMNFAAIYGEEFTGLIHVHHLTPLAGRTEMSQVDPREDLRPVCPNCHAAIHHGGENRPIESIQASLRATNHSALSNEEL